MSFAHRVLALLLVPLFAHAAQPDLARERRLAEQIVDVIFDAEILDLDAQGQRFLGLYTEAGEPAQGTAIILHGRGLHPDWPNVISPLRTALPEAGWNTLSLQLPVLAKGRSYYAYTGIFPAAYPRLDTAFAWLEAHEAPRPYVLIAHSCGSHMALDWIREHGDRRLDAFVGIGMGATDAGQPMRRPLPLARMRVPVLDVYGSEDHPSVMSNVPARGQALARAGQPLSKQVKVADADHDFHGRQQALIEVIREWLTAFRQRYQP